jgi:hypothetical protein
MGRYQTEQPSFGEEDILPADVRQPTAIAGVVLASVQEASKAAAYHLVESAEDPPLTVLEILEPASERAVQGCDDLVQRIPVRPSCLGPDRLLQLRQALFPRVVRDRAETSGPMEGTNNKIKTMKRQAYGFRDREFFKLKILAIHETKYALVG